MELEEFRLLERQLSHETGDFRAQSLCPDPCPAGPAADSSGFVPSSQPYNSKDHTCSDDGAMGYAHSAASGIPPGNACGSHSHGSAHEVADLPTERPDMLSSLDYAQIPNLWEPANAAGLSDAAPQQQHLHQQLRQQACPAEAPVLDAASMRHQAGAEQHQQAANDQGVADWREQVDWAGPGMHAVAASVPGTSLPHEHDIGHQVAGTSTAPYSSMARASGQGQPGNVVLGGVLLAGHACPDPQAEKLETRQDSEAMVADHSRSNRAAAAQGPNATTSEGSNVSGTTGQVRLTSCF